MDRLIREAQEIYAAAVRSVQADRLMARVDLSGWLGQSLSEYARVYVVGAGKASMAMAGALEARLDVPVEAGVVVVPHGYRATLPASQHAPAQIDVVEAGHPVPDRAGVEAARRVGRLADDAKAEDLLIVLLSGGGSALWPAFADGLSLDDVQTTFHLLLESGADIHRINTVRKHLSTLGGGQFAARAAPAAVCALVVSDVVGDDLTSIASGPTVPDPTTFAEAVEVLRTYALWKRVPASIRSHLTNGHGGEVSDTPRPGNSIFERVQTHLLGSNRVALEAATDAARKRGYTVRIMASDLTGEARIVGEDLARHVRAVTNEQPTCLLWGGETTVTVTGRGTGGRNQELVLAAALALDGSNQPVVLLSGGTDGIDGPTDAAGAWTTPQTLRHARERGLDAMAHMVANDTYPFFEQLGALLQPGPTHTNVMDVQVALIGSFK